MSNKPTIVTRGLEQHEIVTEKNYRKVQSAFIDIYSFLVYKYTNFFLLFILSVSCFIKPSLVFVNIFPFTILFLMKVIATRNESMPLRVPYAAGDVLDRNDPTPGRTKFAKAEGLYFVGTQKRTRTQLWLKLKDCLTHMLVFGTTGSGKTVFLLAQSFNNLAYNSGFIYVDPKGSPSLAFQIFVLTRMMGRDDDFRLLNFNLGDLDNARRNPKKMSNTLNPFAYPNTVDGISQMLSGVLPADGGPNQIFSQNGKTLMSGVVDALCNLRDKKEFEFYPATLEYAMSMDGAEALVKHPKLSEQVKIHLENSLRTLGWSKNDKPKDSYHTQFQYANAYFSDIIQTFVFEYSNIFNHAQGEIDMTDVILQRRIAVVVLPSLQKSEKTIKSLGQIILNAIKQATSVGLGNKIEGTKADVLGALPTDSKTPMNIIIDEYAAITTEGFAQVLTQGRSLGVAAIIASQDYGGIEEADKKGAGQIVANTKVKVFLKTEDRRTVEIAQEATGKAKVLSVPGYEIRENNTRYTKNKELRYEEIDIINAKDLKEQTEGECHIILNGNAIRGDGFYADPVINDNEQLRLRTMVIVSRPEKKELEDIYNSLKTAETVIEKILNEEDLHVELPAANKNTIEKIKDYLNRFSIYQRLMSRILCLLAIQKENNNIIKEKKEEHPSDTLSAYKNVVIEESEDDDEPELTDDEETPDENEKYAFDTFFNDTNNSDEKEIEKNLNSMSLDSYEENSKIKEYKEKLNELKLEQSKNNDHQNKEQSKEIIETKIFSKLDNVGDSKNEEID